MDCQRGKPSLPNMVYEGICIPGETVFSRQVKHLAQQYLQQGPAELSAEDMVEKRYFITDLVDDLRAPRNIHEAMASGVRLYPVIADFWLRSQNKWSADGKSIPRVLKQVNPSFAQRFDEAQIQAQSVQESLERQLEEAAVHAAGLQQELQTAHNTAEEQREAIKTQKGEILSVQQARDDQEATHVLREHCKLWYLRVSLWLQTMMIVTVG